MTPASAGFFLVRAQDEFEKKSEEFLANAMKDPTAPLLEAQALRSARKYLEREGFIEVVTPRLVRASGACENINTLFEVSVDKDYTWFGGKRCYLAQTGQLYLEALVPSLSKVYSIGPSFRAEPKADSRHLAEFLMVEIEFAGNFKELLAHIEGFLTQIVSDILLLSETRAREIGISDAQREKLSLFSLPLTKPTYDEAIEILRSLREKIEWGDDISSSQEAELSRHFGDQPYFITHYPDPLWNHGKEIEVEKFFNMIPDPARPGRVQSADLIVPWGGEAVGAAARVYDPETMRVRLLNSRMFQMLKKRGGGIEDFSWYLERLKEAQVPHAGCGFGMARLLKWLRATDDIREAVTFPVNRVLLV